MFKNAQAKANNAYVANKTDDMYQIFNEWNRAEMIWLEDAKSQDLVCLLKWYNRITEQRFDEMQWANEEAKMHF